MLESGVANGCQVERLSLSSRKLGLFSDLKQTLHVLTGRQYRCVTVLLKGPMLPSRILGFKHFIHWIMTGVYF